MTSEFVAKFIPVTDELRPVSGVGCVSTTVLGAACAGNIGIPANSKPATDPTTVAPRAIVLRFKVAPLFFEGEEEQHQYSPRGLGRDSSAPTLL